MKKLKTNTQKNQSTPPNSIEVPIYYSRDDKTGQLNYHLEDIVEEFRKKLINMGAIAETTYFVEWNQCPDNIINQLCSKMVEDC